jgi:hypothetical protein
MIRRGVDTTETKTSDAVLPAPPSDDGKRLTRGQERTALGVLAATVVLGFLTAMFAATEGHFVAQIVDLYLICQYARAAAEGHAFHYMAGEPASTGATSLLHTLVLAGAHKVGFRSEALVAFAIALGAALYVASIVMARRIALRLASPREGLLAGVFVALGGPVVWAFLYGSDIALFMFLALWLLDALLVAWTQETPGPLVLPGVLLALARPEGLFIALYLGLAFSLGPGRRSTHGRRATVWIPALAGVAVLALYRATTGAWLGTSISDKSLFASYGWAEGLAIVSEYLTDVLRGLLLGFYPSQSPIGFSRGWAPYFFAPLALVFVALATLLSPRLHRRPLLLWLSLVALLWVLLAPNMFLGSHFHRYLIWAFPTLHVLVAVGLGLVCARLDPGWRGAVWNAAALLLVGLAALSTLRFGVLYGELAGEVYRRDLAAARWVSANLPPGAHIANLATSVEYLTGHRNVNLHGITSPAFFGTRPPEREAGVFETLGRLPAEQRPEFLMATAAVLEAQPSLREIVDPLPLFRTTSLSDEIVIHRLRYTIVGRGQQILLPETLQALQGLHEVDRLNVCDPRDEASHGYSMHSMLGNLRLHGTARIAVYPDGHTLVDGGRAILGSEEFRVRTEPGRDLVMVLRTAPGVGANVMRASGNRQVGIEFAEAGLVVRADGEVATRATFRPRPGWDEVVVRIPRGVIRKAETTLAVHGRYAAFQYWFFQ